MTRAKNAALRRAGKYPTYENRTHARILQRKVKARMKEVRNENWSDLMAEISPNHKAYWGLAKALKTAGVVPTPALKRSDSSIAFNNREKAECLADSIEDQCSENPPYDLEHVKGWKEAWKEVLVIGIPKPGKQRDFPASYRPISLLSVLVQNKFCGRAADASWYVKNSILHRDLELSSISKYMKDASERLFDIAIISYGHIIRAASTEFPGSAR
ncbi:hypothetical protein EVAR_75673_1 [Eumeta japonica]|uniref:RNA-directed DNA polymerase from mobile element jockey n=1 Tax=Eumeta variegata TaxID=151549 RepID=A0A4C1U033_EUMVA|nr:hypothetical protein EVAR_75673_1 [Eumeta japonica]